MGVQNCVCTTSDHLFVQCLCSLATSSVRHGLCTNGSHSADVALILLITLRCCILCAPTAIFPLSLLKLPKEVKGCFQSKSAAAYLDDADCVCHELRILVQPDRMLVLQFS